MPLSPPATAILADLTASGIEVQTDGKQIRYRPRQAMTPALLERLKAAKAEILVAYLIDQARKRGDADLAERMAEAWQERIAIVVEDGKESQRTAEEIAMKQVQGMATT